MEKSIRLFSGLFLILVGLAIPIAMASLYVRFGSGFWLGMLILYLSLILTGIAWFFSAALIGPAFPGIVDNINESARKMGHALASFLFLFGFAGTKSIWQENEKKAGVLAGFWHGLILPIAFVASLFSNRIQLYETNNKGFFYNLGYIYCLYVVFKALFLQG